MKVDYRRMKVEDLNRVLEIEKALFTDAWSAKSFLHDIENKKYSFPYILEIDDTIMGYTVCWYFDNELHIGNVAVDHKYQGKGYGKLLIQKIFDSFPQCSRLFLEVRASNRRAINLYKRMGFNILTTRRSYYPNGEDAIIMINYRSG